MKTISMVITNSGDGSNGILWVTDPAVIAKLEELSDDGDETYGSGDGLQVRDLLFTDEVALSDWMVLNSIHVLKLECIG